MSLENGKFQTQLAFYHLGDRSIPLMERGLALIRGQLEVGKSEIGTYERETPEHNSYQKLLIFGGRTVARGGSDQNWRIRRWMRHNLNTMRSVLADSPNPEDQHIVAFRQQAIHNYLEEGAPTLTR